MKKHNIKFAAIMIISSFVFATIGIVAEVIKR